MLNIKKESDYGLLMINYLFNRGNNLVSLSKISQDLKLPRRFLARIASILSKEKIFESYEGKLGGYRLGKKFFKTSLYDYLKIFEKNIIKVKCLQDGYFCQWQDNCSHRFFFQEKLNKILIKNLKNYYLKDIFSKYDSA